MSLYFSLKYCATVHSMVWPFSCCSGNLWRKVWGQKTDFSDERTEGREEHAHVWWLAGLLVTLHTRYFLFICPQWVISTFRPGRRNDLINNASDNKEANN